MHITIWATQLSKLPKWRGKYEYYHLFNSLKEEEAAKGEGEEEVEKEEDDERVKWVKMESEESEDEHKLSTNPWLDGLASVEINYLPSYTMHETPPTHTYMQLARGLMDNMPRQNQKKHNQEEGHFHCLCDLWLQYILCHKGHHCGHLFVLLYMFVVFISRQ